MKFLIKILPLLLAAGVAHSATVVYTATLSGPNESPANASLGTGSAIVTLDTSTNTMHVHVDFVGLIGTVTGSHIHSATAVAGSGTSGVATVTPTFTGFPSGVTAGTYDHDFDMSLATSYNPAFVTANGGTVPSAEAALFAGIDAGKAYLNIHTTAFSGGEIRGFLVPEPATGGLFAGACGALAFSRRRRC